MILSVSRRTDIPAFYSEWFINRLRDKKVYVRNPFNYNQVQRIPLTPENVDCIVFWTKDAREIIKYLDEIDNLGYKYYFQYTITPYKDDIEVNVKDKRQIINNFMELSKRLGKERVILRYDPIIITEKYTKEYHYTTFERLCSLVSGYTDKIIFSFVDDYRKISKNMKSNKVAEISEDDMKEMAHRLVTISKKYDIGLETCAEKIELKELGINKASCIDGDLIEKIIKVPLKRKPKKGDRELDNGREQCKCIKCIDIGEYDTCVHGCMYCYANINKNRALENYKGHNKDSPILIGPYNEEMVTERKNTESIKDNINTERSKGKKNTSCENLKQIIMDFTCE